MPIRIRLARHGQRNTPHYHIVAIKASKRRDAKPLEKLGEYDPIPRLPSTAHLPSASKVFGGAEVAIPKEKRIEWDVARINYWLGVGAEPTRSVVKLLERGGVLRAPHKWQHAWTPGAEIANAPTARGSSTTSAPAGSIPSAAGTTTGFAGATAT